MGENIWSWNRLLMNGKSSVMDSSVDFAWRFRDIFKEGGKR